MLHSIWTNYSKPLNLNDSWTFLNLLRLSMMTAGFDLSTKRRLFCKTMLCQMLVLAASVVTATTEAQPVDFAKKPITLVVPFAPGGGTDSIARDLAKLLSEKLSTPVVVENKGGAGGSIAANGVAKASGDGHTLLFVTSTFATHAASDPKSSYDPLKDFTPVALLGSGPLVVVTSKASGITSMKQLLEQAKKSPGELAYCTSGPGGINHLAAEMYAQAAGVKMTHVPYKGSGPATLDLIAGRTQVFFSTVPTIRGQIQSDKVNLLAVTSKERSPMFPGVPTVIESGVPGYDVSTWWGIVAPKSTPANIVTALNAAINSESPALKDRFEREGASPFYGSPAAFGSMLQTEFEGWRKVVSAGIKLD